MKEEIFGPVLSVFVYPDDQIAHGNNQQWKDVLQLIDNSAVYGLTGAVFSSER